MQLVIPTFKRSKRKHLPDMRRVSPAANQFASELEDEFRHMCNEWFFPWYQAKTDRGMKVDDFNGRQISYTNAAFGGSAAIAYWAALDRYIRQKVAVAFVRVEQILDEDAPDPEYELGWMTSKVNEFAGRISHKASETHHRLKGSNAVQLTFEANRLLADARNQAEYLKEAIRQRKIARRNYAARVARSLTEPEFVSKIILVVFGAVVGALLSRAFK